MNQDRRGWIAARTGRLSTGLKMLLILGLGLLPLGIIAVLASIYSARQNEASSRAEMQSALEASAQRLEAAIERGVIIIRAVGPAIHQLPGRPEFCRTTLERLTHLEAAPGRYALFGSDGRPLCATPGFAPGV